MTETITREELKDRLLAQYSAAITKRILDVAFPAKFIPQKGEPIEALGINDEWVPVIFIEMFAGQYRCLQKGSDYYQLYSVARPLPEKPDD